jgi:hypothetical protein
VEDSQAGATPRERSTSPNGNTLFLAFPGVTRFTYLSRVIKAITSYPDVGVTASTDHYLAAAESPLAA